MNRNWRNDTHNLLGDARRSAPKGLLDDIKKEMARRGVGPAYGERKVRTVSVRMRRWGAVAASVAVAVGLGTWLMPREQQADLRSAAMSEQKTLIACSTPQLTEKDIPPSAYTSWSTTVAAGKDRMAQANEADAYAHQMRRELASVSDTSMDDEVAVASNLMERPSDIAAHSGDTPQQMSPEVRGKVMSKKVPQSDVRETSSEISLLADARDSRSMQVSAHMAGMPSANLNGVAGDQYMKMYDAALFGPNPNEQGSSTLSGLGHAKVPGVKAKHYQPIRLGVSVRVPIGKRWSLQTGVNYAYLKSEFKDAVLPKEIIGKQNLHYVGVPVSVSYDMWNTRRLNVYATAGGEVEQLVKGTYKSDAGDEQVKERRPVVSVNAAAGAAFKLSRSVSIYAEPGLSYHFKNGSGVESAYTDRPWGFVLNIGLRWNAK